MTEETRFNIESHRFDHVEMISTGQERLFAGEWYAFATESHFWFEWRLRVLLKSLERLGVSLEKQLNVLEVGCGTGTLRAQLESATNWIVNATDLDMSALSQIKPARGKTMYYDICEERSQYLEAYDVVILFDVLEHIQDTQPFLTSLLRHLKPEGLLLINVPALQILYSNYDEIVGHVRRYDKKTLTEEFKNFTFEIEAVCYWGLSLVPVVALRKLVLAGLAKRPVSRKIECGFNPPNRVVHGILRVVMRAETAMLSHPPLGTSLLLVGRKKASHI
ncbi:MAG TPA: class I SAM-dependent methyltransferase [Pyrinomonadaceae bacterium]|nr:class I SAM-dependent methyltransferase [Pyrinomonadaceae bacterium]